MKPRITDRAWCDRRTGRPHELARTEIDGQGNRSVVIQEAVAHRSDDKVGSVSVSRRYTAEDVDGYASQAHSVFCSCGRMYVIDVAAPFNGGALSAHLDETPAPKRPRLPGVSFPHQEDA